MNKSLFLRLSPVLLLLAPGLSGCRDYSSPQGALATAFSAIRSDRLPSFRKTLREDALMRYGTPEGLRRLRAITEDAKLVLSRPELIRQVRNGLGMDTERVYSVDVLDTRSTLVLVPLLAATVDCHIDYLYMPNRPDMENREFPDCRITGIAEK